MYTKSLISFNVRTILKIFENKLQYNVTDILHVKRETRHFIAQNAIITHKINKHENGALKPSKKIFRIVPD